jgi:hypothetical protein
VSVLDLRQERFRTSGRVGKLLQGKALYLASMAQLQADADLLSWPGVFDLGHRRPHLFQEQEYRDLKINQVSLSEAPPTIPVPPNQPAATKQRHRKLHKISSP